MEGTNYLEYIIPIIFLGIWLFGKIFSSGQKDAPQNLDQREDQTDVDSFEDAYTYPVKEPVKEKFRKLSSSIENRTEYPSKKATEFDKKREQKSEQSSSQTNTLYNYKFNISSKSALEIEQREKQPSPLFEFLKDANSLKNAFLVSEIINPPLALRPDEKRRGLRNF